VKVILAAVVGFIALGIVGSLLPDDVEEQAVAAPTTTTPTATPVPAEPTVEPTVEPTATPEPQPTATPEPEPTATVESIESRTKRFGNSLRLLLFDVEGSCEGYPSTELFTRCRETVTYILEYSIEDYLVAVDLSLADLPPKCAKTTLTVQDSLRILGTWLDALIEMGPTHPQYAELVTKTAEAIYAENGQFWKLHRNIMLTCQSDPQ